MPMNRATFALPLLIACGAVAGAHYLDNRPFKNLNVPVYHHEAGLRFDRTVADDMEYLNVDMMRMEFVGGGGEDRVINYELYDLIVDEAGKRGVSILGLVAYQAFSVIYDDRSEWSQPSFRARYIGRLGEIVERYHDREFPIRAWEIWNEPDRADEEFNVRVDPEPYALMLIEAYETIKAIDPEAVVVFGGISPSGHQFEESYLRDVYETKAMTDFRALHGRSPFDVVGVHPYQRGDSAINPALGELLNEQIREVMNAFGDSDMKVWLTELGWNSRDVGLPQQASLLTQSYHYLQTLTDPANPANGPFVERYFWYQYQNYDFRDDWGLRTLERSTRKASYFAYRDLTPPGREPGGLRAGEEAPVWGGMSDLVLAVMVLEDDLLAGMVPEVIAGGLHEANTGSLADLTDGRFNDDRLSVLLGDIAVPSLHLRYTFPEPVDIEEVRSFAGHRRDWGNRAWQNIDIRVNGRFGVDELRTGQFGQSAPLPSGGVSVVRWMPTDEEEFAARNVTTLDILYHPVSTNHDFRFRDPWHPRESELASAMDIIRDFDGEEAASVASLIKEIDVIGRISPKGGSVAVH